MDSTYRLTDVCTKPSKKDPKGKERHSLWKCRKQFKVRKNTIFEESHRLHRVLGITYKSAWFLTHHIRECMRDGALAPFDSNGGTVEVDILWITMSDVSACGFK